MRFWGFFLVLMNSAQAFAQTDSALTYTNLPFYEASFERGKTLNIHPFFPEVNSATSLELIYKLQTRGAKPWHEAHGYPEIGIAAQYLNFGNDSIMGMTLGVVPHLNFTHRITDRLQVGFMAGGGIAWFNKPFDPLHNPNNYVIGSRFSAIAYVGSQLQWNINPNWGATLGGGMWHYSNGHLTVPNIGANVLMAKAGLRYFPQGRATDYASHTLPDPDKKIRLNAAIGLGWHEVEGTVLPYNGPTYNVYYGNVYLSKRKSLKSLYQLGLTYNYYPAFRDYIVLQDLGNENLTWRSSKMVLWAGHEFLFGRLSFSFKLGANLHYPLRKQQIELDLLQYKFTHRWMSNELGLHYYLKDVNVSMRKVPYVGLALKTIGGKADYVNIRIGYQL